MADAEYTRDGGAWDYIVVGGGSAGCAAAYELARSGTNRVLLLEAGKSNRTPIIKIFAFVQKASEMYDWGYESEPDPTRQGRSEKWVRGKVLGGSSSINGTIYVRGAPQDYDRWGRSNNEGLGLDGWSYADVHPLFQEMEAFTGANPARGKKGNLRVRQVKHAHPLTDAFIASSVAAGLPYNDDYNDGDQEGISYSQLNQSRGLRYSSANAFIDPIRSNGNFKLELEAHTHRIIIEDGKATGVVYRKGGVLFEAKARQVVLSAGAINSPQLLMHSGVGDPEELARHGIAPKVASPEVGKNLREHPLVRLVWRSKVSSNNMTGGLWQKMGFVKDFLLREAGPIATMFESVGFLKSRPDLDEPDIQFIFIPMGYLDFYNSEHPLLSEPSFSVIMLGSYPKSRGTVSLASADVDAAPVIQPNMLEDPRDLEVLVRGMQEVRKLVRRGPMADIVIDEVAPGPGTESDDALRAYIPRHTELCYHFAGTCRMGTDSGSVVDPQMKVRGVENLYVADASIMPEHISGNINAVCMMMGMKLGRQLASQ